MAEAESPLVPPGEPEAPKERAEIENPAAFTSQAAVEPSWRQGKRPYRRLGPRLTKVLALTVPAALLILLLLVLFQPFDHPRVHLFTLTDSETNLAAGDQSLFVPAQNFVVEDLNAFETLSPLLYHEGEREGPVSINSVQQAGIHTLGEVLSEKNVGPNDNLLLYIRAEGIFEGEQAYLVWSFEPERVPMGRFRLRELLTQLAEFPAREKIVFLDTGDLSHDPRLGIVLNAFPALLRAEVERTGDPHLWVLSSHQILQESHRSLAKAQSLFGHYVTRGLQGEADLNSDQTVDLDELHRFVSSSVEMHVREKSDGNASQTPELLWGGAKSGVHITKADWPEVVPVVESLLAEPATTEPAEETSKTPSRKAQFEKAARLSPLRPHTLPVVPSVPTATVPRLPVIPSVTPVVPNTSTVMAQVQQAAETQIQQASLSQSARAEPPPTETPATSSPAPEQLKPDAKPGTAPAADAAAPAKPEPKPLPETIPELFSKVWELRDRLANHQGPVLRPLDYAPHLWRTFQEQMLAYERIYLAGAIADQETLTKVLQGWVLGLERLAEDRTDLPPEVPVLVRRMVALLPQNPLADERVFSLGMLELRSRLAREPLASEVTLVLQTFDQLIATGSPAELAKWLAGLPRDYQQYLEIRLAYRLSPLADQNWPLVQLALRTRRRAEQVPAQHLWAQVWIDRPMARGDRARLEGERELLDQASRNWQTRADEKLRQALEEYETASEAIEIVHAAKMLRHDFLERLPWYVQWWHAAGDVSGPSSVAPGANQLAALMEGLSQLSELLENPASESVTEIALLHRHLEQLQRQIEAPLQNEFIAGLITGPAANGDEWRIGVLLETPLPDRETRMQLLEALWRVDEQLESRLPRFYIPETLSNVKPNLTPADWERLDRRSELDTQLAKLAALHPSDDAGATQRIETAYIALEQAQLSTPPGEKLFPAYAELGEVLRDFYSTLPGRVGAAYRHNENLSNETMRTMCLCALRATDRAIRLVDPRDVVKTTDYDPIDLLRRAEAADLLAWQYDRLNKTRDDAHPTEALYLATGAQIYRNELSELPRTAPPLVLPSPLELDGESQVVVPTEGVTEVAVQLQWKGLKATDVWIVLKYNPDLMDVRGSFEAPVYHEEELRDLGLTYPFRPDAKNLPYTLRLKTGESRTLRFRIQAKANAEDPAPLIVKAVTEGQYIRQAMQVLLPFPELFRVHPGGVPGSWSLTGDGLILHPYPNQETNFQLRLSSQGDTPRAVDVELAALEQPLRLQLPRVALSSEAAADWLARLGPRTPLATASKLTVPAHGETVEIPFPTKGDKAEPAAPPPATPANGNTSPAANGEAAANAVPKIAIPHSLLLVVTDLATGRKVLKQIQLAPQRPRRYLQAQVGYNLERERIEILVQMKDPASFSPHGVQIAGELAEGLKPGWTAQLAGRLQTPNDVARLFVNIPETQGQVVTLRLHADGYPRAFVFRVPCDEDSEDLPEETALHEVRITAPPDGSAFPVPTESVPAVVEVDAPQGSFQTRDEVVQIGIDKDRDRTFQGDAPLQFGSDRQVRHFWIKAGAGGWITLASTVQDFHVDVPTWGLENAEVNLLANLVTPTKTSWSLPRRLVFDGVGPRLARPELNSGDATIGNVVTQGQDVAVSVRASDFAKSGVVKVEAAFDVAGLGKFAAEPPPLPAKLGPNDRWIAVLGTGDLKPGTYDVLFQGTDRVGNRGDYVSTTVQIISPEDAAKRKEERTNVLTGVIRDGKNPAPKIQVTLTPDLTEEELKKLEAEKKKPVSIAPTVTDEQGRFAFPKVQIGDYKITIEGITRGLRRKQEAKVTIPPPPTRLKPLEMRIDKPPAE